MRSTALLVRFLLELAALAALIASGVLIIGGALGWLAGLGAAVVAAIAWGLFVAPRARIALPNAARLVVEVAVFAVAAAGLFGADQPVLAGLLIGLYLADRAALMAGGAPLFEKNPMRG
jgi:hypothetical protein